LKKFFPVLAVLLGIYWIIAGLEYGFWVRKGPGGGFLPIIGGIMAIIFAVAVLIQGRKDKSPSGFTWKAFMPVVGLIILMLCSYLLGLIISIAIYVFVWLRFIEKYKLKQSIITGVSCSALIYLIFIFWLRVPLPSGILGLL
jgi:uncharacterized membrane protein